MVLGGVSPLVHFSALWTVAEPHDLNERNTTRCNKTKGVRHSEQREESHEVDETSSPEWRLYDERLNPAEFLAMPREPHDDKGSFALLRMTDLLPHPGLLSLYKFSEHLLWINCDEDAPAAGQHFAVLVQDFRGVDVLAAVNADFPALDPQRLL